MVDNTNFIQKEWRWVHVGGMSMIGGMEGAGGWLIVKARR